MVIEEAVRNIDKTVIMMKSTCLGCESRVQFGSLFVWFSLWVFELAAVLTDALAVVNLPLQCTNLQEKSDFLEVFIAFVSSANSLN